ncbi:hypothetical protein VPH35_078007 [Triticum aestivum]
MVRVAIRSSLARTIFESWNRGRHKLVCPTTACEFSVQFWTCGDVCELSSEEHFSHVDNMQGKQGRPLMRDNLAIEWHAIKTYTRAMWSKHKSCPEGVVLHTWEVNPYKAYNEEIDKEDYNIGTVGI